MSNFKSSLINDSATARLGQPGGFAKLDENGLVTLDQLNPGISSGWVEATRSTNPMNPFASIPAKLNDNGNPYVWRFSSNGPVSLDGSTVISVTTQDRIWYHISSDTWFHEKQPPSFSGASLANAGYPGLVPLAQQVDGFRVLHGNGQFLFPHQFANTYPAPFVNVIYVGQGLLAKQGEIYELSAEAGDRNGIRITPYTDWADVDLITAQSFSGNTWAVIGQPTSGKQECFVVPDYDAFVWEFKTSSFSGSIDNQYGLPVYDSTSAFNLLLRNAAVERREVNEAEFLFPSAPATQHLINPNSFNVSIVLPQDGAYPGLTFTIINNISSLNSLEIYSEQIGPEYFLFSLLPAQSLEVQRDSLLWFVKHMSNTSYIPNYE